MYTKSKNRHKHLEKNDICDWKGGRNVFRRKDKTFSGSKNDSLFGDDSSALQTGL
eukprot:TRINITY_DN12621_c0_g1_i1.p3 TRINITY_DN12621_c0_g1~~TRINITY_DN12621_c0_g1_i1.p3  ORF type:complete len:55 (-),score=13.26 TRINITY_DN12621_c0_g1_i1:166-330(-)